MRKLVYLPLLMASFLLAGCTAEDYELQDSDCSRGERLVMQIMEMADDYGLRVEIDRNYILSNPDAVCLDSIDCMMKGLASLRGHYKFVESPDGTWIAKKLGAKRAKKQEYCYESASMSEGFTFNYNTYEMSCSASWSYEKESRNFNEGSLHFSISGGFGVTLEVDGSNHSSLINRSKSGVDLYFSGDVYARRTSYDGTKICLSVDGQCGPTVSDEMSVQG